MSQLWYAAEVRANLIAAILLLAVAAAWLGLRPGPTSDVPAAVPEVTPPPPMPRSVLPPQASVGGSKPRPETGAPTVSGVPVGITADELQQRLGEPVARQGPPAPQWTYPEVSVDLVKTGAADVVYAVEGRSFEVDGEVLVQAGDDVSLAIQRLGKPRDENGTLWFDGRETGLRVFREGSEVSRVRLVYSQVFRPSDGGPRF